MIREHCHARSSSDNSVLMEVARVFPEGRRLVVTGKITGGTPMKAVIEPRELRKLLWGMGFSGPLRMAWFVMFSRTR